MGAVHGCVGHCTTLLCVLYCWCDAGIGGSGQGPSNVSGAGGLPGASLVGAGALVASFPGVRV